MFKKTVLYFLGLFILTLGICLIIIGDLGTGAWDSVFVGLQKQLGLTVGTWVFIIQIIILLFNSYLLKEKPEWRSFITIFLRGALLDFWINVLQSFEANSFISKWACLGIGTILLGFGIGIYLSTKFPKSPIDGLMLALQKYFNLSIKLSRTIVELFAVIVGFLLGGPIGIGTIIITFTLGYIVQLSLKLTSKMFKSEITKIESKSITN